MNPVRQWVRPAFVIGGLLFPTSDTTGTTNPLTEGPHWDCAYESTDLSLRCMLTREPVSGGLERASAVAQTIDRRLPLLVKVIWGSPEKLTRRVITIPLWNVPYEMDFARQLAESVMCGARPDCTVSFDARDDSTAAMNAGSDLMVPAVQTTSSAGPLKPARRTTGARRRAREQ